MFKILQLLIIEYILLLLSTVFDYIDMEVPFLFVTTIKVTKTESFDPALRRFIKEVNKTGVLKEKRLRERYVKQSQIRREREKAKKQRIRSDQRRRRR